MGRLGWGRRRDSLRPVLCLTDRCLPPSSSAWLGQSLYMYICKNTYTHIEHATEWKDSLSLREPRLQSNHAFFRDPAWAQPPHPHCPYKWKILCFLISELVHLWVFRCESPTIGGSDVFYSYSNLWFLPPLDRFSWLVLYIFLYLLLNTSFFSVFLNPTYKHIQYTFQRLTLTPARDFERQWERAISLDWVLIICFALLCKREHFGGCEQKFKQHCLVKFFHCLCIFRCSIATSLQQFLQTKLCLLKQNKQFSG